MSARLETERAQAEAEYALRRPTGATETVGRSTAPRSTSLAPMPDRLRQELGELEKASARLEAERAAVDARRAALTEALPSPATVQQSETERAELLDAYAGTIAAFAAAAAEYRTTLDAAERAARRLAALRVVARETLATLANVQTRAGVNAPVPTMPEVAQSEARIVMYQTQLIAAAAAGDPDDHTLSNLSAAKAARHEA
jgi:chromosome segregation ATPase